MNGSPGESEGDPLGSPMVQPVIRNPYEPDLPAFIPVARPLLSDSPRDVLWALPAPPVRTGPGAWRACFELLMLIPACFLGGMAGYLLSMWLGVSDERWRMLVGTLGMGCGGTSAALTMLWLDRESLASIGWTSQHLLSNVLVGIVALATTYVASFVIALAIALLLPSLADQEPQAPRVVKQMMPDMSLQTMFAFMAFVAIWEEVVFRGFVLTRLRALVRTWWLAVPLSAGLFGMVHLYEGVMAVCMIMFLGIILAGLCIRRRSLVSSITMHFLHNVLMLVLIRNDVFGA